MVRGHSGLFDSDTIFILVGSEKRRFTAHINVICTASATLKGILSTRAENDRNEPIILGHAIDTVDAFRAFVEYCYFSNYLDGAESQSDGGSKPSTSGSGGLHLLLLHARVYALAERLQCFPLKTLALKKTTNWYHGYNMQPSNSELQSIVDAIRIIYTYTTDLGSGNLPSLASKANDSKENVVTRDRFRLLLAHFAAKFLVDLRKSSSFVQIHHSSPDFNTDMLLFMNGSKKPTPLGSAREKKQEGIANLREKDVLAFSSLFDADIFTVFVGDDANRFNVHSAAVECSDYFRKLMASDMKEGREKTVYLNSEVDSVEAFDMFVQYCYFKDYFCDENRSDKLMHHVKAYLLAEKLGCLGLKDLALQKASLVCDAAYSSEPEELLIIIPAAVAMIYENTYDGDIGLSIEDAVGEQVLGGRDEEKKGGSATTNNVGALPAAKRDRFRPLLSRFASVYLSQLHRQESFVATHHAFPDFASDVMLLANPSGKTIELDEDGQLKLDQSLIL
ncbi:hypothetical protein TWF718_006486 [Orbilia javanica]|uniref:BTB domain-containing protein n=1 Tax=Orbilia javanica TaxID=47235 RepID=A0AAN8RJZ6_9PEZI